MKMKTILLGLCLSALSLASMAQGVEKMPVIHAHRGGAAVMPENTIPAMINAVKIGTPVLELDMQITKDSLVVVSHDAFLNHLKALKPDGSPVTKEEEKGLKIFSMTYDSLKRYDLGTQHNPQFPNRRDVPGTHIPLVTELIDSVEATTQRLGLPPVSYNIEIKSWPDHDGIYSPDYRTFSDLCMKALLSRHLGDRLLVQCFDSRSLNYVHAHYPTVRLSYLVEPEKGVSFDSLMHRLDFVPQVISPDHKMVDAKFMASARKLGMQVVPWTVDDKAEALRLKHLGVDAIITNRPDAMKEWLKGK